MKIKFLQFSLLFSIVLLIIIQKVCAQVNLPDSTIFESSPFHSQSENSVFISPIDPNIVLNSNNSMDWRFIGPPNFMWRIIDVNYGTSNFISIDGGTNWNGNYTGTGGNNKGYPAVVIDRNGRMYVGYIAADGGQGVAYSDNNGITWTHVQVAPNPGILADKNHLWVDNKEYKMNGTLNTYEGNLYSAWTNFFINPGQPRIDVAVSVSSDNGLTWSPQHVIVNTGDLNGCMHQGVNIQTGANGEVYMCWAIYDRNIYGLCTEGDEDAIGFAYDWDGGGTNWQQARRIIEINGHRNAPLSGNKTMRHNSFPVMTVNQQNGEIYIVWTELISTETDIYMISSIDRGISWNQPQPVGDVRTNDQWLPWIACDEVSGTLTVIYYDSRNDNTMAETYVSISYDRGQTWNDYPISDNDWSGDGFLFNPEFYSGDYIGIDVYKGKAVPVWTSDHTGNLLSYTQPFDVPCTDNLLLCEATITDEAIYHTTNSISISAGCYYTIMPTGNVEMQAGTEVDIAGEFDSGDGEWDAFIDPTCNFISGKIDASELTIYTSKIQEKDTLQTAFSDNSVIQLYPNPSSGKFIISVKKGNKVQYKNIQQNIYETTTSSYNTTTNSVLLDTAEWLKSAITALSWSVPPSNYKKLDEEISSNKVIIGDNNDEIILYVYDILGREIYNSKIVTHQTEIDLSKQRQGIYVVKVVLNGEVFVEKMVVK